MSTRTERQANKTQNDKHTAILKELIARPENKKCADCKKKDSRWASVNLGCFICIRCSGIHRNMGTHISKVRSIDLDTWTPEHVAIMIKWGNSKANHYWEGTLPVGYEPNENDIESFIRAKYDRKQYTRSPIMPDPETIDVNAPRQSATPAQTQQPQMHLQTQQQQQQQRNSFQQQPQQQSSLNGFEGFQAPSATSSSTSNNGFPGFNGFSAPATSSGPSTFAGFGSSAPTKNNDFFGAGSSSFGTGNIMAAAATVPNPPASNAFASFGSTPVANQSNPNTGFSAFPSSNNNSNIGGGFNPVSYNGFPPITANSGSTGFPTVNTATSGQNFTVATTPFSPAITGFSNATPAPTPSTPSGFGATNNQPRSAFPASVSGFGSSAPAPAPSSFGFPGGNGSGSSNGTGFAAFGAANGGFGMQPQTQQQKADPFAALTGFGGFGANTTFNNSNPSNSGFGAPSSNNGNAFGGNNNSGNFFPAGAGIMKPAASPFQTSQPQQQQQQQQQPQQDAFGSLL